MLKEQHFTSRTAAHCRLSGWLAGEGQRAVGATVHYRGGVIHAVRKYFG
jgi:hypothetical protein